MLYGFAYVLLLLIRLYPYTGVGYMGNKPYGLDGLLSWLSRLGSKSVQTMILLENFLRLESARGRRYLYSPGCRKGGCSRKHKGLESRKEGRGPRVSWVPAPVCYTCATPPLTSPRRTPTKNGLNCVRDYIL
jgi:hypothetical protein